MATPRHVPRQGDDPDRFVNPTGGPPPLHLVHYHDYLTLCEDSTGLLVGVKDRRLPRIGIVGFSVRSLARHADAARQGDFSPGSSLTLVREPGNQYDRNAIAIYDSTGRYMVGYANKANAARLARQLDAGEALGTLCLQGAGPGLACNRIAVLVAMPDLVAHLARPRPAHLPPPSHPAARSL